MLPLTYKTHTHAYTQNKYAQRQHEIISYTILQSLFVSLFRFSPLSVCLFICLSLSLSARCLSVEMTDTF